jgi:hypothetical protein
VRTAFLALLLLNLAYFAWAHWIDAPRHAAPGPAASRLPELRLASEVPAGEKAAAAAAPQVTAAQVQACFSVGPFADVDNSAKAAAVLRAKGFDPRQRAESAEGSEGYWVFVSVKSDADSDRALATLEHSGIKDALVMPASADAPRRLSLGLFSERTRADRRAQSIRGLGLNAEVAERKLPGTVYWVDLAPLPGTSTIPIQDLFAEAVSSRIAVQTCPAAVHLPDPTPPTVTAAAATAPGAAPRPAPTATR